MTNNKNVCNIIVFPLKVVLVFVASVGLFLNGMTFSWPNAFASDLHSDNTTLFTSQLTLNDWEMDMTGKPRINWV